MKALKQYNRIMWVEKAKEDLQITQNTKEYRNTTPFSAMRTSRYRKLFNRHAIIFKG
jgi:hypothetical protein